MFLYFYNKIIISEAAEKSNKHGEGDKAQHLIAAIRDRMKIQERNKPEIFDTIKTIFHVDEKSQQEVLKTVKNSILEGSSKWSAKIHLTSKRVIVNLYFVFSHLCEGIDRQR